MGFISKVVNFYIGVLSFAVVCSVLCLAIFLITNYPLILCALSCAGMALVYWCIGRISKHFIPEKIPLSELSQSYLQNFIIKVECPFERTTIVSYRSEWNKVHKALSKDLAIVPILGFDCEWVPINMKCEVFMPSEEVALIQLATYTGRCVLVRVCNHFPAPALMKILEDDKILKVGVGVHKDIALLRKDFGVQVRGAFDVRILLHKYHPEFRPGVNRNAGLAVLSEKLLGVKLNKQDLNISCSNWEADLLNLNQIKYAAQDALASLAVCLKMVSDIYLNVFSSNKSLDMSNLERFYSSWSKAVTSSLSANAELPNRYMNLLRDI